ncbi:PspC domain-containing protein [Nonomuraea sp. NPDC047897]|uniref:PspC domain-containing protein n=1 Tax=Nonomuraea sp. NPDC047897 TaxID=3364346 RepID=UPI003714D806
MTQAPPKEAGAPPRALRRSREGRLLLGICAGLGRHTGIDPVVFRVAFAVLLFGSGIGLFLYIAAFLLMKEPSGRPGYIETWTQRDFDAETVLALLTAVLGFGLAINLTTVWLDTGTLVVGVLLAVSLLAAHSSGVDLVSLVRSMPERLNRRAAPPPAFPPAFPTAFPTVATPAERAATGLGTPAGEADRPPAPVPGKRHQDAAEGPAARPTEEMRLPPATGEPPSAPAEPEVREPGASQENAVYGQPFAPRGPFQPSGPQRRHDAFRTAGLTQEGGLPQGGLPEEGGYQPLDPRRRAGWSPYDPALYGRPAPRRRRPRSFIGLITVLLAIVIGGIVVAVQAGSGTGVNPTVVGGAVLVTVGAGLLVAAWWGRGAGLVAAGTAVALLIALAMAVGGMPREVGNTVWVPLTANAAASRSYDLGLGSGRLDLSEIELAPGADLTVRASVRVGELLVIVPPEARVEVHAVNRVGDIKLDQSLRGGVDVKWDKVLEPEVRPRGEPPTIALHLRGGMGDVEVRRAA